MNPNVRQYYQITAAELRVRYDRIDPTAVYAPLGEWIPEPPARILDIGAGTGRDAVWFAQLGHEVHAIDPVPELRADAARDILWSSAHLPELNGISGSYDLIIASAVWHHIAPMQRSAALGRIKTLCAPSGRCLISLRQGPVYDGSTAWPVDVAETSKHAGEHGFSVAAIVASSALQAQNKAAGVRFTWLVFQSQDAAQVAKSASS